MIIKNLFEYSSEFAHQDFAFPDASGELIKFSEDIFLCTVYWSFALIKHGVQRGSNSQLNFLISFILILLFCSHYLSTLIIRWRRIYIDYRKLPVSRK